jgi:hypothetical protein
MPLEITPGTLLEDREVLALVVLSAGGAVPQDARTLAVYEKLRSLGLTQRRTSDDPYSLPAFALSEAGETAIRFHRTQIAEILDKVARERKGP